ncbi:unnamed protein product [Closterium sp. Naga37s-1]|nr:unnamed protein product [Closterium sp. Naga37s-1]
MALELPSVAAIATASRPAPPVAPPPNLFAVTGFKPFMGVAHNPTEAIVRALPAYLAERKALPEGWALGCCCVLETAGKGCLPQLLRILDNPEGLPPLPPLLSPAPEGEGAEESGGRGAEGGGIWGRLVGKGARRMALGESAQTGGAEGGVGACAEGGKGAGRAGEGGAAKRAEGAVGSAHPVGEAEGAGAGGSESRPSGGGGMGGTADVNGGRRVIWVHLGVNSGASLIAVERQAANEATFRCPDEMGWQPQKEAIAPEDGPITVIRQSTLPFLNLVSTLQQRGFSVCSSRDAGRFVCNYVYYESLRHAALLSSSPSSSSSSSSASSFASFSESLPHALTATTTPTSTSANSVSSETGTEVTPRRAAAAVVAAAAAAGSESKHHPLTNSKPALQALQQHPQHAPHMPHVPPQEPQVPQVQSVFVHVPTFDTIAMDAQLRFVAALLELLAAS